MMPVSGIAETVNKHVALHRFDFLNSNRPLQQRGG
jgi:hypothetical protein